MFVAESQDAASSVGQRWEKPPAIADDTNDPVNLAEWAEFHEQIERLPERAREVFDLVWYDGLSHADAADPWRRPADRPAPVAPGPAVALRAPIGFATYLIHAYSKMLSAGCVPTSAS